MLIKVDIQKCDLDNEHARSGDQAGGCRAQTVECSFNILVLSKSVEHCDDEQDNYNARGDNTEGRSDRARYARRHIAGVGRHVDADRARRGLGHSEHVGDHIVGKPACSVGHIVQKR